MFLHQQFYVLHFHAVHVQSVPERKLWKLVTPLPNSKTFRAVSGVFFSSQYHGIVDSRCFVFISRNLWFSVSVHLKASFCLISFTSGPAWVLVAAVTVTHSYLRVATCLNICARAFQLLMINWLLDLLPQAECSRMKMDSSFTIDLENHFRMYRPWVPCDSVAEHSSLHKASRALWSTSVSFWVGHLWKQENNYGFV